MQNNCCTPPTSTTRRLTIPCLSIKQPWSWLIVNRHKNFENRPWRATYRGPCLVHASRMPDPNWLQILKRLADEQKIVVPENATCGAVVGVMEIVGCVSELDRGVTKGEGEYLWFVGPWAFKLDPTKAFQFETPIPMSGRLGFFHLPLVGPVFEQLEKIDHPLTKAGVL